MLRLYQCILFIHKSNIICGWVDDASRISIMSIHLLRMVYYYYIYDNAYLKCYKIYHSNTKCAFTFILSDRWVSSKSRVVSALKNNLCVTAAHLEAMAADNIPHHSTLVSVQYLKTMHVMLDFLPIITRVSKVC